MTVQALEWLEYFGCEFRGYAHSVIAHVDDPHGIHRLVPDFHVGPRVRAIPNGVADQVLKKLDGVDLVRGHRRQISPGILPWLTASWSAIQPVRCGPQTGDAAASV